MSKYKAIVTTAGAAKIAAASAGGKQLKITHMAVGDGNGTLPTPNPEQTKLVNEKYRAALNTLTVNRAIDNHIIAEFIIPANRGGFWLREMGLYDDAGTLIAVSNMAESYKPKLEEGSGRTQTLRMVLIVSSTEAIQLIAGGDTVLATRDFVDDAIKEHEKTRNHPDASKTAKGFVQLSSKTTSSDETKAATSKAIKDVNDASVKKEDNLSDLKDKAQGRKNLGVYSSDIVDKKFLPKDGGKLAGEIQSTVADNYRIVAGDYGTFWRNDGKNLYLMLTKAKDQYGAWNELRPLMVDVKTGNVTLGHALRVNSDISASSLMASRPGALPEGSGAYAAQLDTKAPFYQESFDWDVSGGGCYVPLVKGRSNRKGQGYPTAVSFGYLLDGKGSFARPCIHVRGDNNAEALWQFDPNSKQLLAPGNIAAGDALFQTDGNVRGTVWGGYLSTWLNNQFTARDNNINTRTTWDWANQQFAARDNNINTRATWDYVNQNFVRDIRLASRGEITTDGWMNEAPGGGVITGGNGNEGNQVGSMFFRYLQKNVNGNWYTVAYA